MSSETRATTLPTLYHISAIVEDIDKTAEFLSSMWGIGPWQILESSFNKKQMVVSEPGSVKLAGARLGPTILELLQPLEGRTIWADFLETHGEGLHHIAFSVPNWDEMASKLQQQGGRMIMSIVTDEGRRYSYFETKPGGIIVEFEEKPAGTEQLINPPKPEATQPDLYHINFAVKDVDKTAQFLTSMWGIGPWQTMELSLEKDWMDMIAGEPYKIKLAFGKLDPIIIELIQPVEGRSFLSRSIETRGEGINHMAFSVSNWQEMAAKLQEKGGRMVAGGVQNGMHWGYFETTPGGIVIEFEEKMGGKQQFIAD